jgi:galactose mutarotase-like enzyme
MAAIDTREGREIRTIRAEDGLTSASFVPALGGIAHSITAPFRGVARELLFRHPFFWEEPCARTRGGWPFLFPICGRLKRDGLDGVWLHGGTRRYLPIHGFSMRLPWRVEPEPEVPDALALSLAANPDTREVYPFDFHVRLDYHIRPGALEAAMAVTNRGETPMPYYAGFHPYFLTPPPGAGKEEVRVALASAGQWLYNADKTDILGRAGAERYPASIQSPRVNETLNEVADRHQTRLEFPDGLRLGLEVTATSAPRMFPFVQLYTMPDQPFFCIEPWMGAPNALNTVFGARRLEPGATDTATLRLTMEVRT